MEFTKRKKEGKIIRKDKEKQNPRGNSKYSTNSTSKLKKGTVLSRRLVCMHTI